VDLVNRSMIAGGHEVAANSTALDVSKWGLAAAQVREVAGALPQLRCLRELVLDGVPVSGAIPRNGDFKYGAETVDADLGTFRALCEGLRACQGLASLSLKKCYVGTQALALLADLIKVIAALTTLRCGSNPGMVGELYPSGDLRTPDVHIEALQQLLDALKPSGVTELDISKIGIGPVGVGRVADYVREAKAALNSLTCDSTGVPFVHYVDRHATGPRTYTLTVGEAAIDLSSKNFGPADVTLLTVWMKRPEVMAALASVNCSGNGLTGAVKKNGQWNKVNSDLSGFVSLCTVLGKVTEVNLSDCGLGPASMPELVKMFSDPSATLKKVVLSHNFIFGSKDLRMYDRTQIHDIDADQSGWTALCDALPASPVEELDVANVGMGVAGVTSLAKAISAGAALKSLTVSQNAIGGPVVRLIDSAKTGVTVNKGVFAAVNGRWGQVNEDPDEDDEVKLTWLDDDEESDYTKADKLDPVVSSRADLVEDYSHIEQLGQAITRLSSLDMSNCNFTPASIKIFTSSVSWRRRDRADCHPQCHRGAWRGLADSGVPEQRSPSDHAWYRGRYDHTGCLETAGHGVCEVARS
jgi:hypothetical protein